MSAIVKTIKKNPWIMPAVGFAVLIAIGILTSYFHRMRGKNRDRPGFFVAAGGRQGTIRRPFKEGGRG